MNFLAKSNELQQSFPKKFIDVNASQQKVKKKFIKTLISDQFMNQQGQSSNQKDLSNVNETSISPDHKVKDKYRSIDKFRVHNFNGNKIESINKAEQSHSL